MEISNSVTADEAIAALNVVPPRPSRCADFFERLSSSLTSDVPTKTEMHASFRRWMEDAQQKVDDGHDGFLQNYLLTLPTFRRPPTFEEPGWHMPGTVSRKESYPMRDALTSAHLRSYVDDWLDTGRRADGTEEVEKRDLTRASSAYLAFLHYVENAPPTYDRTRDPVGIRVTIADRAGYLGVVSNFFDAQITEAQRLFSGIVQSDWKHRLCKCRSPRCGVYFLHPKPRRSYRRGTFCPDHARHAVAVACVHESRSRDLETLINAAARSLRARKSLGPDWLGDKVLKRELARELNLIDYRKHVGLHWVTHHQALIEQKRLEPCALPRDR